MALATGSSVEKVCEDLGCSKSQAYKKSKKLLEYLQTGHKSAGRPRKEASPEEYLNLVVSVRDYLADNPGAIEVVNCRRNYSHDFRTFVIEKVSETSLSIEQVAEASGVPLGTLKSWMNNKIQQNIPSLERDETEDEDLPSLHFADPQLAVIISSFPKWKGTFKGFCKHLREHHRIPYKETFVASVLTAAGLRNRHKKEKTPPWSPKTYEALFPGFQWLGDGKKLVINFSGHLIAYNIEALVDVETNAILSIIATDVEDEESVIEAYKQAKITAQKPPNVVTLDNKPSNHSRAARDAMAPAELLPSTPKRPTAKAPVEGAFGLFSQFAPEIDITGNNAREVGRSMLQLCLQIWAWARNLKPRSKLGGLSPKQAYLQANPTDEEIRNAKIYIQELKRRSEIARKTREQRADPVRLNLIVEELKRLNIHDPESKQAVSLASFSMDAILRGLAIFRAKKDANTIPDDSDHGRYLGGIIRNLNNKLELELFAEHLLELRLRHRELSLAILCAKAEHLRAQAKSLLERIRLFVKQALQCKPLVDFRFWLRKAKEALLELQISEMLQVFKELKSVIATSFKTSRTRREDLIEALAACISLCA